MLSAAWTKQGPEWRPYIRGLTVLSNLDGLAPGPEMRAQRDQLEAPLLADAPKLFHDGQRAVALEIAIQIGAARLVHALRPVGAPDLAGLTSDQWSRLALQNSSPALIRAAVARDLSLSGILVGLWPLAIDAPQWRAFLLEDVSRNRWWLPRPGRLLGWFANKSDTDLACAFLRAQMMHHPEAAAMAATSSDSSWGSPVAEQALLLHAGAPMPREVKLSLRNRLQEHLGKEGSSHARVRAAARLASPETIHLHHGK